VSVEGHVWFGHPSGAWECRRCGVCVFWTVGGVRPKDPPPPSLQVRGRTLDRDPAECSRIQLEVVSQVQES
jgi:hypothetical protein